jgi:poly(A) polymerase
MTTPKLKEEFIDRDALQIVRILKQRGFATFLVGGCVRDLLLGKQPKDYDIATNARPQDVRRLISNAFIIGKRFRLVLVKRGDAQFEVATFRRDIRPDENIEELPGGVDNIFGTPEEDARRRDFTINGLFYDPVEHRLLDYCEGRPDLEAGVIRMIGDPEVRLAEDPIRILRGIRLAHMIRFALAPDLREAIKKLAETISTTALPRRREEILKFLRLPDPTQPLMTSYDLGVLPFLSPSLNHLLHSEPAHAEEFLLHLRHFHDKSLTTPTELFAGLILSYFMTINEGEISDRLRAHDILEDKRLLPLMRDELGMFKIEQTQVAKAMQTLTLLRKRKDFEQRGARRRSAFVNTDSFELALKLADRIHWLKPNDLQYWHQEYDSLRGEKVHSDRAPRRRRRRRRKDTRPNSATEHGVARTDEPNTHNTKSSGQNHGSK